LSKELEFKRLFYFNLIPAIIPGTLSVILAYLGYGVWALVYGSIMSSITLAISIWFSIPWRPRLEYRLDILKELIGFGGFISFEAFLGWGITKIDNLFVGKFLGVGQLGIYSFGWNIGFWPLQNLLSPLTRIFYPMFSGFKGDIEIVKKYYLKIMELIAIITFPVGTVIALTAHLFIPAILGQKWISAIPVIQLLSIMGILGLIVSVAPTVYKAIGRPDIMPKFMLVRALFSVPVYFWFSQKGIIPLCIAHLILAILFVPINSYISMRVLNISFSELLNYFSVLTLDLNLFIKFNSLLLFPFILCQIFGHILFKFLIGMKIM
jgi:O-antigen/teichoic acid export membrane protein